MLSSAALLFTDPDFMLSLRLDASLSTLLMLGFDWLTVKVVLFYGERSGFEIEIDAR